MTSDFSTREIAAMRCSKVENQIAFVASQR